MQRWLRRFGTAGRSRTLLWLSMNGQQYRATASHGLNHHHQGKRSGRHAALHSPIYFSETAQSPTNVEGQEGNSTHQRLVFASTNNRRRIAQGDEWPSQRPVCRGYRDHCRSVSGPVTPSAVSAPVVVPQSSLAYRARLQQGRAETVLALMQAPYAPSPLQVLMDIMSEILRHEEIGGGKLVPVSSSPSALPRQLDCEDPAVARQRLSQLFRRAADIRAVLEVAAEDMGDTAHAASIVGDATSSHQRRRACQQLTDFLELFQRLRRGAPAVSTVQTVRGSAQHLEAAGEGADMPAPWVSRCLVSNAVTVAVLQGSLVLSRILGSHLIAVQVLEDLIQLSEEIRAGAAHRGDGRSTATEEDGILTLDNVVAVVDAEVQSEVRAMTATDHLNAMESCVASGQFNTAYSLYKRYCQQAAGGVFAVSPEDFAQALTTLARCCRSSLHWQELQDLIIHSEAASTVPVSVPFYTALVDAVSRTDLPNRMAVALALYRRLRDGGLVPTVDTYAALIACSASTAEPTHAFAFYHEARALSGISNFTPQLYTNLLLAYANAGFGADARRTLDVLVEAGAPLTRSAFHAVLSAAVTFREAQEVVAVMEETYSIPPTPHTYAFLVHAAAKAPAGVQTALILFDLHESVMQTMLSIVAGGPAVTTSTAEGTATTVATSSTPAAIALETRLLESYPMYVRSIEHALMRVRIDPSQDRRLPPYLKPLLRLAQQRMNAFTEMPPQAPTRIPNGATACIAVLAPDVLTNIDEWVMPFISYYSAVVIPYSALLALQLGKGRRVEGLSVPGVREGLQDAVWQEVGGTEHEAVVEHRRRRLVKFLQDHRDVVHLVSLEEELQCSKDTARYSIPATNWTARSAALALHWAREEDVHSPRRLYASHPNVRIVLVSANFDHCGRYIVDLKDRHGQADLPPAMRRALGRVTYHNPRTRPHWVPPTLSIAGTECPAGRTERRAAERGRPPVHAAATASDADRGPTHRRLQNPQRPMSREAAEASYRQQLEETKRTKLRVVDGPKDCMTDGSREVLQRFPQAHHGAEFDADLLMAIMNE